VSSEPRFSPDGKFVYFIADDDGTQNLCRVSVGGGEITRPIGGRLMVYSYSVANSGDVAAQITTMDRPSEIFTIPGSKLTRITHTNDEFISQVRLTAPEYVKFKSKDGTTVSGYLYKPLDYVPGKKYPAILRPHGGPVWSYYAEFTHLAQLFAANGYVVLYPNPRGSTGYGQAYAKAIEADWGNKDFQDDMAMVDYASHRAWLIPTSSAWGDGPTVASRPISLLPRPPASRPPFRVPVRRSSPRCTDMTSTRATTTTSSDIPGGQSGLGQGLVFLQGYEYHDSHSVHGRRHRLECAGPRRRANVPGAKDSGRETELVVYPAEYHEFKAPSHLKDRLERYLAWYAHYVKADGTPERPAAAAK